MQQHLVFYNKLRWGFVLQEAKLVMLAGVSYIFWYNWIKSVN